MTIKSVLPTSRQEQIKAKVAAEIQRARAEAKRKEPARSGFNERRRSVRVAVKFAATYGTRLARKLAPQAGKKPAVVTEISRSGLRLLTSEELTLGASIELDITLGAGFAQPVLRIGAKVVRLTADDERGFEYGLKLGPDPAQQAALGAAVLRLTLNAARPGRF